MIFYITPNDSKRKEILLSIIQKLLIKKDELSSQARYIIHEVDNNLGDTLNYLHDSFVVIDTDHMHMSDDKFMSILSRHYDKASIVIMGTDRKNKYKQLLSKHIKNFDKNNFIFFGKFNKGYKKEYVSSPGMIRANLADYGIKIDNNQKEDPAQDINEEEDENKKRKLALSNAKSILNDLIGLKEVKNLISNISSFKKVEQARSKYGKTKNKTRYNIMLVGDSGTGKTEIIKCLSKILYGAQHVDSLNETWVNYTDVVHHQYGGTEKRMKEIIDSIEDGFLIIDNLEVFCDRYDSPTIEETMNAIFKNNMCKSKNLSVICAGTPSKVNRYLNNHSDIATEFDHIINIDAFEPDVLMQITDKELKKRNFTIDEKTLIKLKQTYNIHYLDSDFTNAKYVNKLIDEAIIKQSSRLAPKLDNKKELNKQTLFELKVDDFNFDSDDDLVLDKDPYKELDNVIGLDNVKKVINKIVIKYKMGKLSKDVLGNKIENSLHMCFSGNPGTAKTTIARIIGKIFKEEGILRTGKFVELSRANIIGKYYGHTEANLLEIIDKAKGGVLFIDEAYSLYSDDKDMYGKNAIDLLVKEIEDNRNDLLVIFAGYEDKMDKFLSQNEGLKSRVPYHIVFDNYDVDTLIKILKVMCKEQGVKPTKGFLDKAHSVFAEAVNKDNFSNGRFVRNVLELALTKQAVRLNELNIYSMPPAKQKKLMTSLKKEDFDDNVTDEFSSTGRKYRSIGFTEGSRVD